MRVWILHNAWREPYQHESKVDSLEAPGKILKASSKRASQDLGYCGPLARVRRGIDGLSGTRQNGKNGS